MRKCLSSSHRERRTSAWVGLVPRPEECTMLPQHALSPVPQQMQLLWGGDIPKREPWALRWQGPLSPAFSKQRQAVRSTWASLGYSGSVPLSLWLSDMDPKELEFPPGSPC